MVRKIRICEIGHGRQQHLQHKREEDTSHRAAAGGNCELDRTPINLRSLLDVFALRLTLMPLH